MLYLAVEETAMSHSLPGKPIDSVAHENAQLADARKQTWPSKHEHVVRGKQNKSVMSSGHGGKRKK